MKSIDLQKVARIGFVLAAKVVFVFCHLPASGQQVTAAASGPRFEEIAAPVIVENGFHHRVIQTLRRYTNHVGEIAVATNSYVELQTGLNRLDEFGRFVEASDRIDITDDGAVAVEGQHQVHFAADINTVGAIQLVQPDGQRLASHVLGLRYFDARTGATVLLAQVKSSTGVQTADNQIIYPDAFEGMAVDIRYTNSRDGFEQDLVLRESPIPPEAYGLDPATTRLEVMTEFVEAPEPDRSVRILSEASPTAAVGMAEPQFVDVGLDFKAMFIGPGKAFGVGETAENPAPVGKRWQEIDGRRILIEAVEYPAVQSQLDTLPEAKPQAALPIKSPKQVASMAIPKAPNQRNVAKAGTGRMQRASQPMIAALTQRPGLVVDYQTLNGTLTNYTFRSDTTYFITGSVTLNSGATFEGGTVLKFTNSTANPKLNLPSAASLTWLASQYRPVIMTGKDDDSVGAPISGSSGDPTGTYYANPALMLNAGGGYGGYTLACLRINHAKLGLDLSNLSYDTNGFVVSHLQMHHCSRGIAATSTALALRNALFSEVNTNLSGFWGTTARCEHLTSYLSKWFAGDGTSSSYYVTNSLIVEYSNIAPGGTYTLVSSQTIPSDPGIFDGTGNGGFYLLDGTYRNTGTTNINAQLAKDLKLRTTYRPADYAGETSLSIQALRDTDTPDLGYHYDPLDYQISSGGAGSSAISIQNGVTVGVYGTTGFVIGGSFTSAGGPTQRNWITRIQCVQEQGGSSIAPAPGGGMLVTVNSGEVSYGYTTAFDLRFVNLSTYADGGGLITSGQRSTTLKLRDCEFYNGTVSDVLPALLGRADTLQNNFFERVAVTFDNLVTNSVAVTAANNLFRRSSLTLQPSLPNSWSWHDNLFDNSTLTQGASLPNFNNGYYPSGSTRLQPTATTDKVLSSHSYSIGALGRYYLSGSSTLLDAGSGPADVAGLYHYTTLTAQTKETTSVVDIGLHYVALNGSSLPVDSDSDGNPDYSEDPTGAAAQNAAAAAGGGGPSQGFKVFIQRPKDGENRP